MEDLATAASNATIVMMSLRVTRNAGRIGDVRHAKAQETDTIKRQRWPRSKSRRGFHLQFFGMFLKMTVMYHIKSIGHLFYVESV